MADQGVAIEVRELREQVAHLRSLIEPTVPAASIGPKIRVHVERVHGKRKPYLVILKAPEEKRLRVSPTRVAIILALLADLESRSAGNSAPSSVRGDASEILRAIGAEMEGEYQIQEQIRLGLYRFSNFWKEEIDESYPVQYDSDLERLYLVDSSNSPGIELRISDPAILDALPRSSGHSTIERLKQERFLFVPGGGLGTERFLKEIYSCSGNLDVTISYFRPQMITFPSELLKRHSWNPEAIARHRLMQKRLEERTLYFTEIVPETSILDLITPAKDGSYRYFKGLRADEVMEHLQRISRLIQENNGYRLILTRAEIPFYVGLYRSSHLQLADFFRLPDQNNSWDYSSFAVWGSDVSSTISTTVMDWLVKHPSSITEPGDVLKIIEGAMSRLQQKNQEL